MFIATLPQQNNSELRVSVRETPPLSSYTKYTSFDIDPHRLAAYCFSQINQIIYDLLTLVAAVEYCDAAQSRPLTWRRVFFMQIPVFEMEIWKKQAVKRKLYKALESLTGDIWNITFIQRSLKFEPVSQRTFDFPSRLKSVLPCSNGLDSFTVSNIIEQIDSGTLLRVRVGSEGNKEQLFPNKNQPFTSVPYHLSKGRLAVESTMRSRGFKFSAISAIAAFLAQVHEIILPESGQGILGPALIPSGPIRPDYRCHPEFLLHMKEFIKELLNIDISFGFPRIWNSKAQTLKEFIQNNPNDARWQNTRSCWQNQRKVSYGKKRRQCGICAACMLRRVSVFAAGLCEEPQTYIWDNLHAKEFMGGVLPGWQTHEFKSLKRYAVAGTRFMHDLATFPKAYGSNITLRRAAANLERTLKIPGNEIYQKLLTLLSQHRKEWEAFLKHIGPQSFIHEWID